MCPACLVHTLLTEHYKNEWEKSHEKYGFL
ncbi:hypothetical protein KSP9073_02895 [Kushneria phyllosphaerae]|uniref:Uncharacterized protein n=1 Tax=Kushneria phyllosphaerae TaxID=2100822 RepID=A0A2R8CPL8_9GAMM|nr:hypothetical protein KSP9073_02895 [Kushneria phyllosphaerae]